MLTLGYAVGTAFTQSVKGSLPHGKCLRPTLVPVEQPDSSEQAAHGSATCVTACERQSEEDCVLFEIDPNPICKFPNTFNNTWLNATFHSVLNLTVVQDRLRNKSPSYLSVLSCMPITARLFLRALNYPGRVINPTEIHKVVKEVWPKRHKGNVLECIDILDFLDPFLRWLDRCGVDTSIYIGEKNKCGDCSFSTSWSSPLGRVCFLPTPISDSESLSSLYDRSYGKNQYVVKCKCGSDVFGMEFLSSPDILTFYLSRASPDGSLLQTSVPPSKLLYMYRSEYERQLYRLSAVICYSNGKFWAYLFRGQTVIKAEDSQVTVLTGHKPEDLEKKGVVFMYEKGNSRKK